MRPRLLCHGTVFALGLAMTSAARAETFSLQYDAIHDCPSDGDLAAEVLARTSSASRVTTKSDYHFSVRLLPGANNDVEGTLSIRSPSGRTSQRTFDGPKCDEVVSAMALVIALAVDPRARLEPIEQLRSHGGLEATTTVASAGAALETDRVAPSSSAITTPERPKSEAEQGAALAPLQKAPPVVRAALVRVTLGKFLRRIPDWALGLGVHGEWMSALAPGGGMLLAGVHLDWRSLRGPVITAGASFGPRVRRDYATAVEVDSSYVGGAVDVGWQLQLDDTWGVDALFGAHAGVDSVRGVIGGRVAAREQSTAFFCAVGPGVRLRARSAWGDWDVLAQLPVGLVVPTLQLESNQDSPRQFYDMPRIGVNVRLSGTWSILEASRGTFSNR